MLDKNQKFDFAIYTFYNSLVCNYNNDNITKII